MSTISRRTALAGGSAAIAVVAALPAVANVQADDTALLSKVHEFHASYDEWVELWNKAVVQREAIEALPNCPDLRTNGPDGYLAFIDAHRQPNRWAIANDYGERIGQLVTKVFATPAKTPKGILEKARILFLALGDIPNCGDRVLEAYQCSEIAAREDGWWVHSVVADLEDLAGEART